MNVRVTAAHRSPAAFAAVTPGGESSIAAPVSAPRSSQRAQVAVRLGLSVLDLLHRDDHADDVEQARGFEDRLDLGTGRPGDHGNWALLCGESHCPASLLVDRPAVRDSLAVARDLGVDEARVAPTEPRLDDLGVREPGRASRSTPP